MTSRKDVMLDKTRYLSAFGNEGLRHVDLWFLSLYLDRSQTSFLDASEAIRIMFPDKPRQYHKATGVRFKRRLAHHIETWLDEDGISALAVKENLFKLLRAKQTKYQKLKGDVDKESLPPGAKVVAKAKGMTKHGEQVETLVAVTEENLELQTRVVEDLAKMKGMNAPDKVEVSGLGDIVEKLQEANAKAMRYREEIIEIEPTSRRETVDEESDTYDRFAEDFFDEG